MFIEVVAKLLNSSIGAKHSAPMELFKDAGRVAIDIALLRSGRIDLVINLM